MIPIGFLPPVERVISDDGASFWEPADRVWRRLWLDRDRVAVLARELGVGSRTPVLLDDGYMNQTWLASGTDESKIVRVGRAERTLEQAEFEAELLSAWARDVPAVVTVERLACDDISTSGHVVSVFPFREGVPGTSIAPTVRAQKVAPALARMHRASLRLGLGERSDVPGLYNAPVTPLWQRVKSAINERFPQSEQVATVEATISRAADEIDQQVLDWARSGRLHPMAAIHGDLNARNQIYRDQQLVGIIDADDCRLDSILSEVAGLAYSDPKHVNPAQVWQLYQEASGPLPAADEDLLLPLARQATLRELQWCITDIGHAHPRALETLTDIANDLPLPSRG